MSAALRNRIEIAPESGTLTIKGEVSPDQIKKIAETFTRPETAKKVREGIDTALSAQIAPPAQIKTPAERGEIAKIPRLLVKQDSFYEVFDETMLLEGDWEIDDFDPKLSPSEFSSDVEAMRRARLSVSQLEKIEVDVYDRMDAELTLFAHEGGWSGNSRQDWCWRNNRFLTAF